MEYKDADIFIIMEDIPPIHEKECQNFTLESYGINRFSNLKFSIKFLNLWFPPPENEI